MLAFLLPFLVNELFAGSMIFTDRGSNELRIADLDGSNVRTLISAAGTNVRGVAIDTATEQLFYADNGGNIIYRTQLDGSSGIPIISTDLNFPADLVLDCPGGKLYWCDRDNNRIERSNYDGGEREAFITTTQPYFLDLDLVNRKIYWGDFSDGNIFRADLSDGANVETVVSGLVQTRGVKVDPRAGYLYWCDRNASKVQRRKILGGDIEDLYINLDTPHGMTLDTIAGKVYWVDTGTNDIGGTGAMAVNRGDIDGSGLQEILVSGNEPWDIILDTRTNTYSEWVARRFQKDAPSSISDPNADPDLDNNNNLSEYFRNSNPFIAEKEQLIGIFEDEGEFLFSHLQSFDTLTDLEATVEISNDLQSWSSAASFTEQLPSVVAEDGSIQVFKLLPDTVSSSGTFLRLRLELITQ